MNSASLNKQMKNLSQSKIVLYILLLLSVTNLFGYLMSDNFVAVFMFLVISYLTTYFTNNMIHVFAVSLIATNFAVAMNYNRKREGLANKKNRKHEKNINDNTITANSRGTKFNNLNKSGLTGKSLNINTVEAMNDALKETNKNPNNPIITDKKVNGDLEGICNGSSCKKNSKNALIENSHSMVDHLIKNPEELTKHQEAISKTIETLEPMIDKVETMMNKIGGSKIANLIGGLGPILGQINPQ